MLVWAVRLRCGRTWGVDLFVGGRPSRWRGRGPWAPSYDGDTFAELSPAEAEVLGLDEIPFNQPVRVELMTRVLGN